MLLSRLNKFENQPAHVTDQTGAGFWKGVYTEVGEFLHWKDPKAWTIFYVTADVTTGEIREGFVRRFHAQDRADAIITLARHYTGCGLSLILHDVVPPMTEELITWIEIANGKLFAARAADTRNAASHRDRSVGRHDARESPVRAEGRRAVSAGV